MVGTLHRPDADPRAVVVLAHGAGANREATILVAVADELCARGLAVARIDLPYRQRRPKGPPSPSGAGRDRDGIRAATAHVGAVVDRDVPVFVGGHSYGGRQASMVAAESPGLVDGLILTSYPLHPPGKPDRLRTEHFPEIDCGVVVVHGASDPFATHDELVAALELVPGPTTLVEIAGVGHDLRPDRKPVAALTGDAVFAALF
nr:alpha/beta fold hydrolase [Williamsia sterculiae]